MRTFLMRKVTESIPRFLRLSDTDYCVELSYDIGNPEVLCDCRDSKQTTDFILKVWQTGTIRDIDTRLVENL